MTGRVSEVGERVLHAAAEILQHRPFETVTLAHVSEAVDLDEVVVRAIYGSMHELGSAILAHEGESMRNAQRRAQRDAQEPLERLRIAFRYTGDNLAEDVMVRAGIRIAGESHHCFPERNISPFRTWRSFISAALDDALAAGAIRPDVSVEDAAWLLTAAGLGTKDLLSFTNDWQAAPALLEQVAVQVIHAVGGVMEDS